MYNTEVIICLTVLELNPSNNENVFSSLAGNIGSVLAGTKPAGSVLGIVEAFQSFFFIRKR